MKAYKTIVVVGLLVFAACAQKTTAVDDGVNKVVKTEEEWKKQLTDDEYKVLREKATEKPYTGEYDQFWDSGVYVCKACGNELFYSNTKFDAGCGWPSFFKTIDSNKITTKADYSLGVKRIEVMCARCMGHLGHVFDDGPDTTGLRYCINSISLGFTKK